MNISSSQTEGSTPKPNGPTFSIITIHHGLADVTDLLFCCTASTADQENIKVEQIVQHTSGVTGLWNKLSRTLLKKTAHYTLRILEEKNSSFYDLLQRGLQRAQGTFFGCLQPEEQYLPGALAAVEKEFQTHPELDVVMTSCLVIDPKTNKPTPHHATSFSPEYLATCAPKIFPCTLFFRATLLAENFTFDPTYDEATVPEWLLRLLKAGKKIGTLNFFTSVITQSTKGQDTSNSFNGHQKLLQKTSATTRFLGPWWKIRHQLAAKKNKTSAPVNCLLFQSNLLTERKPL